MKISSILNQESKWTKNCLGRDKEGKPLASFDTLYLTKYDKNNNPYHEEVHLEDLAVSFSLQGVIAKCSQGERESIMKKLSDAIRVYTGKNIYVAQYNDSPDTTFEDITQVLKIAEL